MARRVSKKEAQGLAYIVMFAIGAIVVGLNSLFLFISDKKSSGVMSSKEK